MPLPAKFAAKPAAPPKKKPSAFGPAEDSTPRDPMLARGSHRVRVTAVEEQVSPKDLNKVCYKATFEVITSDVHPVGDARVALFFRTTPGIREYKVFVARAAGYATAAEYSGFDPDGDFFETMIGIANEFAARELTIVGRLVDVRVTLGNPVIDKETGQQTVDKETGQPDHFRDYSWTVVADDAGQDTVGKVGEA